MNRKLFAKNTALLKKLDKLLENSELTEEDCLIMGEKIKTEMWKKYKAKN